LLPLPCGPNLLDRADPEGLELGRDLRTLRSLDLDKPV
jgi:hypothetical protein